MKSERQQICAWANLPSAVEPTSLWCTLHDGYILAIESDLLARTVTLTLDIHHLRQFHQLDEGAQFVIELQGVRSVQAFQHADWPVQLDVPDGANYETRRGLEAEHYAKGRNESWNWSDFERLGGKSLHVMVADLAQTMDGAALFIGAFSDDELRYAEAYIGSTAVSFRVAGQLYTLEEFIALGDAYWEASTKRRH